MYSEGILVTAAQLGTTIIDMERHNNSLQKNIEITKKDRCMLVGKTSNSEPSQTEKLNFSTSFSSVQ
jgi:hypothetical protein